LKVRKDFTFAATKNTLNESIGILSPVLGSRTLTKAARDLGLMMNSTVPVPMGTGIQVPALGDSKHCLPPRWPENLIFKAKLNASVYAKKNGNKKLWDLTDRTVPKNVGLRFSITTNVPPPYEVRWQVVNTGREAAAAGQLRGDFYESDDRRNAVRWESTAYVGTHWVEAFVIKNGSCVARSGRKQVKVR
jgi:hypothetical protein